MQDDQMGGAVQTAVPERTLHSDPHDFAGLYIRHRSSFTLHARRYLRDQRDADEVVQEAFLRLFLALPELETELQALAYCRRTITNLCIDRYRAQARRPHLVDLESVPPDQLVDDEQDDPVVRAEDAAVVREALSLLSPLHRAALVKREIEEKSLPVIAAELEIPEDSVKHVLFRARRALRRVLAGTSVAPEVLVAVVRKGGGGLAAVALVLAVGLGSGPNLHALPMVGADLPDLPGIGQVARNIVAALTGTSGSGGAVSGGAADSAPLEGAPLLVAVPSSSPSPSPSAVPVLPAPTNAPATGTVVLEPATSVTPAGSAVPSPAPSLLPPPTSSPLPSPTGSAGPAASGSPAPTPTGTATPAASGQASPASTPDSRQTYRQGQHPSPEPSPGA